MARLPRPYIPLRVRCLVALRQCFERGITPLLALGTSHSKALAIMLSALFQGRKVDLHHRPALENREQIVIDGKFICYVPDANDSDFLIYLENNDQNNDHYIETHVRGVGALRSDTGQRNHQKALDRNRGALKRRPKVKIRSRGFDKSKKRKWPKRKFGG